MSWDEQLVEDFLLEYRKHECLWNPFNRQFHDCLAKGEALKKVVKNLRLGVGVQDCLRLLKCIREKYVEDQTKNLLKLQSSICQPKWMQIVESMLKKIVCDEECKSSYLAALYKKPEPTIKLLFRHTIPSKKRKCPTNPKQKRGRKKCKRSKLERRGRCCNNNVEKDMDPCRAAQDCSRSQSNWCKQRDDYLDKLSWTQPSAKAIECPGLASHIERVSRIENVGKDPCASTPVYMCPNRATHTHCNQNHGRRRNTDIYPTITESRSCKSPPPRPQTCPPPRKPTPERNSYCPPAPSRKPSPIQNPCCSPSRKPSPERNPCASVCPTPRKPTPERNSCSSSKKEKKHCPSPVEDKCMIDKDTCTRDTCPSYSRLKTNDSSKACEIKQAECPLDRNVRFDRDNCTPRVAARFENGVLEAYSQFKVVFPSQDEQQQQQQSSKKKCCAQKVQTDRTTRECAVAVSSREFLRGKSNSKCNPRKKDMLCGTDEDFVECNNERNDDPCHDYVLLTPGGKYVPLVRTNDADEEQCACAKIQKQDSCERQDTCTPVRNCEKQNSTLEDDKCPSTTTKLLLRCLEHMLNLEEQQSTSNTKSSDICEPCQRRNKERNDQLANNNVSSSCLPCLEERLNNNNTSQRGKLTQNFLEILKCAMELDCNNRKNDEEEDDCDEDQHRNNIAASSTPMSPVQRKVSMRDVAIGCDDKCCVVDSKGVQENVASLSKSVQCEVKRSRDKQVKRDTPLDNLVRCANWPKYKTARNLSVALKCDDEVDDVYEPDNVIKRVPATTLPASTQQKQRDQALACLREELQRDQEYFDQGKVSYVKCNQVYKSYIVRSPPRLSSPNRRYHR